jgi:hypothetical protein
MSLLRAPMAYSRDDQDRLRTDLDALDGKNRKKGADVEIAGEERLILASPNGSRWSVTVDNSGVIAAVAL